MFKDFVLASLPQQIDKTTSCMVSLSELGFLVFILCWIESLTSVSKNKWQPLKQLKKQVIDLHRQPNCSTTNQIKHGLSKTEE